MAHKAKHEGPGLQRSAQLDVFQMPQPVLPVVAHWNSQMMEIGVFGLSDTTFYQVTLSEHFCDPVASGFWNVQEDGAVFE